MARTKGEVNRVEERDSIRCSPRSLPRMQKDDEPRPPPFGDIKGQKSFLHTVVGISRSIELQMRRAEIRLSLRSCLKIGWRTWPSAKYLGDPYPYGFQDTCLQTFKFNDRYNSLCLSCRRILTSHTPPPRQVNLNSQPYALLSNLLLLLPFPSSPPPPSPNSNSPITCIISASIDSQFQSSPALGFSAAAPTVSCCCCCCCHTSPGS